MKTRFGEFMMDDDRRLLLREHDEVHVSPKAYELLKALLARRPAALSKAELHDQLWPATFVADISLATVIAELRAALGERGRRGRFIRTVHGFGYAFDGEAAEVPAPCAVAAPTVDPAAVPDGPLRWHVWGSKEIPLGEGDHVIGRTSEADVQITELSVSRRHARLSIATGYAAIEDLGSKNGTWLRGLRVLACTPIEDGDEIRLGSVPVVFRNLLTPAPTRSAE